MVAPGFVGGRFCRGNSVDMNEVMPKFDISAASSCNFAYIEWVDSRWRDHFDQHE